MAVIKVAICRIRTKAAMTVLAWQKFAIPRVSF